MTIRVMMVPSWENIQGHPPSGIWTVVREYTRHLREFDVELVSPKADSFDLLAVHAGMGNSFPPGVPCVAHLHGAYFSSDYAMDQWQMKANRDVIASILHATLVTVPSEWVSMFLRRDMHLQPRIIGHGVDWQAWQHAEENEGYIIGYAKNRIGDACSPRFAVRLANKFSNLRFLGTFAEDKVPPNYKVTGVLDHEIWKRVVQRSAVFVSTTRETFCAAALEAQAAGVPVLGFNDGGIRDFVRHGESGYLAQLNNFDDLCTGLNYCLEHRDTLGANARELAKEWTWERAAKKVAEVYGLALAKYRDLHSRPFAIDEALYKIV